MKLNALSLALAACFPVPLVFAQQEVPTASEPAAPAPDAAEAVPAEPADAPDTEAAVSPDLDGGIEEIIVTAQKRKESLSAVPMSISALSGDDLAKQGINSVGDLAKIVPGFRYTQSVYSTPIYSIRGIGFNENSIGAKPNVSVYVDEVPLAFPVVTLGASLDAQRVEILKGPQGTLFGQNSTGGAVNYIANKPTEQCEGGVSEEYGSFNTAIVEAYVSGPLAETLRGRIAVKSEQGGAWQQSHTSDRETGKRDKLSGRALLDWTPLDALKVALNLNGYVDRSDEQAGQFIAFKPLSPGLVQYIPPGLVNYPRAPKDNRAADWGPDDNYERDNRFWQASLRADYGLSETLTLTAISAYSKFDQNRYIDSDGTSFQDIAYFTDGRIESLNQELRLTGSAGAHTRWIVGANYTDDDVEQIDSGDVTDNGNAYALVPAGSTPFFTYRSSSAETFKDWGVFGNVDHDFTSTLTGHLAARYTESKIDFAGCTQDFGDNQLASSWNTAFGSSVAAGECITFNPFPTPGVVNKSLDEDNTSWRVGLDWKAADALLVYGNVSKGYKSGSFPNLSAFSADQYEPVKQESVVAYELGFKHTADSRKLRVEGAAFYYDYKDKQVRGRRVVPVFNALEALVNVPKSTVQGAELQVTWLPVGGLTTTVGLTYVDSEIGNFSNYGPYGQLSDFDGERFPLTPQWQGFADLQYEWPLGETWLAFAGGNLSHQGKTYGTLGEIEALKIDAYTLLDLRTGVESQDSRWRITLWGRNVTDEYYWTLAEHVSNTDARFTGMPATYGVSVAFRYR